jgi:hypothetical protein
MVEISILLKKETIFDYGECHKNFNDTVRFLVEHYPPWDDQNSTKLRVCFIRVYVFASAATFNTVFCFFLANQTFFKDEFLPTTFFIDDQVFDANLK